MRRAVDDGYVFVTNNSTDFTSLVGREELHAGLICLNMASELMGQNSQGRLFQYAIDRLMDEEPINEILEITLGSDHTIEFDRYPSPTDR